MFDGHGGAGAAEFAKQQMYAAGMVGLNVCVAVDTKKLAQFWPPTISFFFNNLMCYERSPQADSSA